MIVVRHQPSRLGWEFFAPRCNLVGGGRSLEESKEFAEHTARHYVTKVQGYPVDQENVRHLVRHVVEANDLVPA